MANMILSKLLTALFAIGLLAPAESRSEEGFVSIFNGLDLAGWHGPTDGFEVREGSIAAKPGRGGTIYTRQVYSDFTLRLEFKLPPNASGGLALRFPGSGDPAYVGLCEIKLRNEPSEKDKPIDPRAAHGSAFGMVAAKPGSLRPTGEWNVQEVTVRGSTLKVTLNGALILDCDLSKVTTFLDDHPHPGKDRESGHLGLTADGEPIQFRHLRLKKIISSAE